MFILAKKPAKINLLLYCSINMTNQKHSGKLFNQLFLTMTWFCFTTAFVLLGSASYSFFFLKKSEFKKPVIISQIFENKDDELAKEQNKQTVDSVLETEDARSALVASFLERHNSPMKPYDFYGEEIVKIADRYELDFRLLPAIAMQESNLCKVTNSGAPHNCLGFGIHSRGTLDFETYEAGFERAGRELKQNYINQGLTTVELIETKYTPSSNGSWAHSVNQWMAEIRYDDRDKGRSENVNTDVMEFAVERE